MTIVLLGAGAFDEGAVVVVGVPRLERSGSDLVLKGPWNSARGFNPGKTGNKDVHPEGMLEIVRGEERGLLFFVFQRPFRTPVFVPGRTRG